MRLNPTLLHNQSVERPASSVLHSNWKVKGSYHPTRFVLRLRPASREEHALEEQVQAFSTYLHETIHWWQYIGSTLGLALTLSHPAQTHYQQGNRRTGQQAGADHLGDVAVSALV
jgi:hypothetical protein